mgnify:FL=1
MKLHTNLFADKVFIQALENPLLSESTLNAIDVNLIESPLIGTQRVTMLYSASTQIPALLDTGAASSFITFDLADTLHLPIYTADTPIKVKGAFSTNTNTASSIAEMTFTIRGCTKEFTISLYVVDSIGSHKLIIGNPILQQFPELLTPVCLIDTIDCDSYFDDVESTYVIDTYLCDHCVSPDAILIAAMSSEVNPHQLAIDTILKEYPLAIADELPQPTSTSAYRHSIELLPDAPLPKSNPFTLSLTEEEEVTTQIDKLLELEHIVPSTSSLASPCFIG